MLFIVHALDKPNHLDLRLKTRETHLAYLAGLGPKAVLGGPYLDDQGQPIGSMVIYDAADRAELDRLVAGDPYALAGLFASVEVRPWRWVLNPPQA